MRGYVLSFCNEPLARDFTANRRAIALNLGAMFGPPLLRRRLAPWMALEAGVEHTNQRVDRLRAIRARFGKTAIDCEVQLCRNRLRGKPGRSRRRRKSTGRGKGPARRPADSTSGGRRAGRTPAAASSSRRETATAAVCEHRRLPRLRCSGRAASTRRPSRHECGFHLAHACFAGIPQLSATRPPPAPRRYG